MSKVLIAGTVALAMMASPAFARGRKSAAKSAKPDQRFVTTVARDGIAEVELGKLAADKASSPEVKQFAQRMVDDHSKANDELKSLAQTKGITLPSAIASKEKSLENRLSKLSGPAFDRAYLNAMVTDHR